VRTFTAIRGLFNTLSHDYPARAVSAGFTAVPLPHKMEANNDPHYWRRGIGWQSRVSKAVRKGPRVRAIFRSKDEAPKAPSWMRGPCRDYSGDKQSLRSALKEYFRICRVLSDSELVWNWKAIWWSVQESGEAFVF